MKTVRLAAAVAFAAGLILPGSATAQTARDGVVSQAVLDTLGASLLRRGFGLTDPASMATAIAMNAQIETAANTQKAADGGTTANWQDALYWLLTTDALSVPLNLGADEDMSGAGSAQAAWSGVGGGFGGGGASGSWGEGDCSSIKIKLDAQGNLIIPSYSLGIGTPIALNDDYWGAGNSDRSSASSPGGAIRRALHLTNMGRGDKRNFYGVIGYYTCSTGLTCVNAATVAYMNGSTLVPRATTNVVVGKYDHGSYWNSVSGHTLHKNCPEGEWGGDLHPYGNNGGSGTSQHIHGCAQYLPDPQLGESGYAINPETSINWKNGWPEGTPESYRKCALDARFMAKLTDALLKKASEKPGYSGVPYAPVQDVDGRPGDSKVADLGDNPVGDNKTFGGNATNPPTPSDPDPPTSGGSTDVCDFGEGGCDNPNTAAPSLDDPPTGIMDPIFEWLPDLPSITLPDMNSACPTFAVNLTEMFGPSGQWLIDDHCPLVEQNAAIIGALMVALFGIAAAQIILRA